jgi:hypothetical protein
MRCIAGTAAVLALAAALAGCGGGPSKADCKKALKAQFATALASGKQGHEPPECKGLSAAVLRELAGQVLSGQ